MNTPSRRTAVPTLHSLIDDAIGQLPELARFLLEAIHDELHERPQYLALQGTWRLLRGRFVEDFKASMLPRLREAREGRDPIKPRGFGSLDGLSLVDEKQALRDVGTAHVVSAAEDANRHELLQLTACFAALQGTLRPTANSNPLRPAVFVQALQDALERADTDAQGCYALMQAAAQPMSKGLAGVYITLCRQLQDAELSELISRHVVPARRDPSADHLRLARGLFENSRPNSFDGLSRDGSGQPAPDLLSRLYKQILADDRLLPPVKALISRAQIAVVRLAKSDPTLLRNQEHPAWQLLNRIAAQGMAYERADDPRLREFLAFIKTEVESLVELPLPTRGLFEQSLARLEAYIGRMAQQRSQRSAAVLEALEREERRGEWLEVIGEQIAEQTRRAPLGPRLRDFLRKDWPEAIVQAMVLHGHDAPEAQDAIELVDPLLESLHPVSTEAERQALRQSLPGLVAGLRSGAAILATPAEKLDAVLQELMELHGRLLRGLPLLMQREAAPATPAQLDDAGAETEHAERLRRLMDERPSQMPSRWAEGQVDRAELPTVPVQLYSRADSPEAKAAIQAWINGMTVGTWYHLFVQGGWQTAQLVWIGESRQHHLFVSQETDERHSLTHGALERLLPNGLITALGEDSVVQRAVDSLMQNLGDA